MFHASPAFLLLFVLFTIFLCVYLIFSFFFKEFAGGYTDALIIKLEAVHSELEYLVKVLLESFSNIKLFKIRFLGLIGGVFKSGDMVYHCEELNNTKNYSFLSFLASYRLIFKLHITDVQLVDISNPQQRVLFVRGLLSSN